MKRRYKYFLYSLVLFTLLSCYGTRQSALKETDTPIDGTEALSFIEPGAPDKFGQVFISKGMVRLGSNASEKAFAYGIGGEGAKRGRWFDIEVERDLFVDDFYIDVYPVTQEEYRVFVEATGHRRPFISESDYLRQGFLVHPYFEVRPYLWKSPAAGGITVPPLDKLEHPVVLVSVRDASLYCAWRGKDIADRNFRLPKEDEWEKAARGTDGRYFPWGNVWDGARANIRNTGPYGTTPVTRYEAGESPYGVHDMAGNIFEWTRTPLKEGSDRNILKSCSWDDQPGICRGAARHARPKESRHVLIGFRCVSTVKAK